MRIQLTRNQLSLFLAAVVFITGTLTASSQTYLVSECQQDFAVQNLGDLSQAFDLCPVVSRTQGSQAMGIVDSPPPHQLSQTDLEEVQRNLYIAFDALSRANVKLTAASTREVQDNKRSLDWLKISGIIVGGIGGGVGGGLHLVNNPSVGHVGTVIGMSAGILGAGINLTDVFFGPKTPSSAEVISPKIRAYLSKKDPALLTRTTPPSATTIATKLSDLSDSLEQAQAVLDKRRQELLQSK